MDESVSKERDPVPAVSRASAILDLIASTQGHGLSVGEIAKELGLARSSTANLCSALHDLGFVRTHGGQYYLGHKLLELGAQYLSTVDQVQLFYDLCENTVSLANETARLALLDGMNVVYLARYDGTQPLRLTASIGDRFPASITATGKAILSTYDAEELDRRLGELTELPRYTDKSLGTPAELRRELEITRLRGYAVDDEETTPDVVCFSVPIEYQDDRPCTFAVSGTIHKSRDTEEFRAAIVEDLNQVRNGLLHPIRPHVRSKTEENPRVKRRAASLAQVVGLDSHQR